MKRFVSALAGLALFAWITPLGSFIRPSQEKEACGGKRAFHMCSMMSGQVAAAPADGLVKFTPVSGSTTAKSAAGSGDEFLHVVESHLSVSIRSSRFAVFVAAPDHLRPSPPVPPPLFPA